ncbi:MAG: sugar ABC transporter permease [Planctomycetota bacterium]|jgi:raffinose/stachyose/melibiose transport system permease protein|nr:sugar ABC transporter permease [Planctomycetota bacterium]
MRRRLIDAKWLAVYMLGPALLIYLVFAVYPSVNVLYLSFVKWNGLDPEKVFVGLENYRYIFQNDPVFWKAFNNTMIWTFLSLVFPPLIGFVLALALNQRIWGRSALRAIFYMPVIIASIAVATMWRWMYDPFYGVINWTLSHLGLDFLIQDWLGDGDIAIYSIFVAFVWQSVGTCMVLFLAGLQNVSLTLIEAARIDGASRWNVFRHVTLPAVSSTIAIVLVLTVINSLKAFDIVYGMSGGGIFEDTQILALWTFVQSMNIFDFGRGSAIAVILILLSMVVVVPYMFWLDTRRNKA